MAADEKLFLFAVAMVLALLAGSIIWLHEECARKRLRKIMTPELAMQEFCHDGSFDLRDLLHIFKISDRLHDVEIGLHGYRATLSNKRVRLDLSVAQDGCALRKIEYYCDANWQFRGWYTLYSASKKDKGPVYRVFGATISDHEAVKKELPAFQMTGEAIKSLTLYLTGKYY